MHRKTNYDSDYDHLLHFIVLGDTGVGKSSLVLRFTDDTYTEAYISTIGVDYKIKTIQFRDKITKIQVWDGFKELARGAHGILLLVDMTNAETLSNATRHLYKLVGKVNADSPILLVGTKLDLINDRKIQPIDLKKFVEAHREKFPQLINGAVVLSSQTNKNVNAAFYAITQQALHELHPEIEEVSSDKFHLILDEKYLHMYSGTQIEPGKETINQLQENKILHLKYGELQTENKNLKQNFDELQKKYNQTQRELVTVQDQLTKLMHQCLEQAETIEQLNKQLEEQQQQHNKERRGLESELYATQQNYTAAMQTYDALEKQQQSAAQGDNSKTVENLQIEIKNNIEKRNQQKTQIKKLEDQVLHLKRQCDVAENQLNNSLLLNVTQEEAIEELKQNLDQANQKLNKKQHGLFGGNNAGQNNNNSKCTIM